MERDSPVNTVFSSVTYQQVSKTGRSAASMETLVIKHTNALLKDHWITAVDATAINKQAIQARIP